MTRGKHLNTIVAALAVGVVCVTLDSVASDSHDKVQLWEGGPYWATTNIGADNPWDSGLYFWWGDTVGHRPSDGIFDFNFSEDNPTIYTYGGSWSDLQDAGWLTDDLVLTPAHDAAHVKWGGGWRMPTYSELWYLCKKCDWTWTTMNGVMGCIVRGRGDYASNSIFLPCAGHAWRTSLYMFGSYGSYWSSESYGLDACYFFFDSRNFHDYNVERSRYHGYPIRPVQGFDGIIDEGVTNYALKFDANASDATGTMYDMSVAYGEPVSLPVCMFEREGYFFVGWSTNPNVWAPSLYNCETRTFDYDSGGVYRPGDTWWIGEDSLLPDGVTLYAVWGKNYTVRLRKNKGEIYEADDVIVSLAYGDVLPQNPFGLEVINGRSDTFIGWATSASLSELDECLYEEGSLWDGDGELPGSEVILYAVWGRPVSYTFYNDNNSVPRKLEPQGLEKLIKWRCKCWYSHWHPEGVGVWHDGSETIFLPPGNHEIEFSCAPAADEWVNADSLKNGDVLTIPLINGENGNPAWQWTFSRDIHRYVDLSLPNAVKVRFNYSLMYSSGATTEEFDESLAKIRLKFYGGEEMYEVKAGSVVPLELDRSYTADFSYEGGWLSAWIGSPINFKPRDLKPDPLGVREVTGYFIRVQESGFGEGQYLIDLYSDANESWRWTLTVSIGDRIYLPKFLDKDGKKFSGWFTKPDWFGRRRKIENNFAEVTKDFLESIKYEYEDGGHSYELHARWDTSIPSIIGGWFSSVINSESAISVSLPSTTVGIHASAFVGCENVEEVVFEGNAPEVESGAFDGLSSDCVIYVRRDSTGWGVDIPGTWNGRRIEYIEYVEEDEPATSNPIFTIEDGVLTAVDLNGATEVTIPEGAVTEIDYGAFKDLTSMISVAIPASVDYIHVWAFDGCSGLTNITVSEGNACYKSVNGLLLTKDGETLVQGVNGDVAIPFGVTTIGDSAFYGCSGLSSVDISDSVIIVDDYAFGECSGLTSVVMPVGMTSIGTWAFGGCVGLTSVTIPDSVTSIGTWAFGGCVGLTSVTIPDSVTSIGEYTFAGCPNLHGENWGGYKVLNGWVIGYTDWAGATIPNADNLKGICSEALKGCAALKWLEFGDNSRLVSVGAEALKGCTELRSLVLPPSLASIGDEAFMGCSYLDNVIVPGSVRSVGARAFKNCTGFTDAQIEYGVESLGDEAFYGCWQITEVDIPSTVNSIGANAFGGDSSIVRVGLRGDIRPVSEIFSRYHNIKEASVKIGTGNIVDGLFKSCSSLKAVHFYGNCPGLVNNGQYIYNGTPSSLTTYVERGSTGWDGTMGSHQLPQSWPLIGNRRSIECWDVPTYLVEFDSNGGTLGIQNTYQCSERNFSLPPEPAKSGYAFDGWWTKPSGGLRVTANTVFIVGVYRRLYAHWIGNGSVEEVGGGEVLSLDTSQGGVLQADFAKAQSPQGALVGADGSLAGMVQVKAGKVSNKGIVKISATVTLMSGKKVSAKAISLNVGGGERSGKLVFKGIGEMDFKMADDGTFMLMGDSYAMADAKVGGNLPDGKMTFAVDVDALPAVDSGFVVLDDLLPDGVELTVTGGKKINAGKAATIKYAKDKTSGQFSLVGLDDPNKPNLSSLKLTYTPKTGVFKGSYTMYATNESVAPAGKSPKLKKYKVNVTGFMVDDGNGPKGVGTATIKGKGSVSVTIK